MMHDLELKTIDLSEFAEQILFATTLEDKLYSPKLSQLKDSGLKSPLQKIPDLPTRPQHLTFADNVLGQKANRPSIEQLHDPIKRATFLHTFANHELLALELMALAILRYTDAPRGFRMGLAQVILDEQRHFKAYQSRVEALGMTFGSIGVNSFFWRCVADAPTVHDFNARISLILEQANLDFCHYYHPVMSKIGDQATADVLEMVYQDEVKHVKYGLHWFRQWKPNASDDDWHHLQSIIHLPLSLARAKGPIFSTKAREEVGFDPHFIQSLEAFGGSLGRPPVIWCANFHAEDEIDAFLMSNHLKIQGDELILAHHNQAHHNQENHNQAHHNQKAVLKIGNVQLKKGATALIADLLPLLGWIVKRGDVVLCDVPPSLDFQQNLVQILGYGPEWLKIDSSISHERHQQLLSDRKIGGFSPWGWTDQSNHLFKPYQKHLIPSASTAEHWIQDWAVFYSKSFAVIQRRKLATYFQDHHPEVMDQLCFGDGYVCHDQSTFDHALKTIFQTHDCVVMKVLYAQAGRGQFRVRKQDLIDGELARSEKAWVTKQLQKTGLVLEPWWDRVADFSFHGHIDGENPHFDGICSGLVDEKGVYRGTWVSSYLDGMDDSLKRFLLENQLLQKVAKITIEQIAKSLLAKKYIGVFGIDVMVIRHQNQMLLYPLVEINPRWTMGRFSLSLKHLVAPKHFALFRLESQMTSDLQNKIQALPKTIKKLEEGTYLLNDPKQTQKTFALLIISKKKEIIFNQIET